MKKTSLLWIALVMLSPAADQSFHVGLASSYSAKQTNENVTVAAVAYDTEELAHSAFGKTNPNQYGVLPVPVQPVLIPDEKFRIKVVELTKTK